MSLFFSDEGLHLHDFHVSKLDMNINPVTNSLECSLHLFVDDLERAMKQGGFIQKNLISGNVENEDQKISGYLSQKIKFKLDGKPVALNYIGKEEAERFDAYYVYFEVKATSSTKNLEIEHKLFHEIFDDQKNIISFTKDKKLKDFLILEKDHLRHTFKL
ncbi:MAG: hypothetical protein IPN79_06580 [Saprospiraceae bacterium]|nr:hypothetical protein [Saprospiraceae bacterium]